MYRKIHPEFILKVEARRLQVDLSPAVGVNRGRDQTSQRFGYNRRSSRACAAHSVRFCTFSLP